MMKMLNYFLSLITLFLVSSCIFQSVTEEKLIGSYRGEYGDKTVEYLELRPSGECYQEIQVKNGQTYKATGTWKYFPELKYIHFTGTRIGMAPDGNISSEVEKIFPGITGAFSVSWTLTGKVKIGLGECYGLIKQ